MAKAESSDSIGVLVRVMSVYTGPTSTMAEADRWAGMSSWARKTDDLELASVANTVIVSLIDLKNCEHLVGERRALC